MSIGDNSEEQIGDIEELSTDNDNEDYDDDEVVEEGDPVKPGGVLVRSEPFVYAIQPHFRTKVCENCLIFKDGWRGIELCDKCGLVGYCSTKCKQEHSEKHRVECELSVLRGKKTWPHRAWFVARAILRVDAEGYLEKDKINKKKSRTFHDLMDHYEDITGPKFSGNNWYSEVSELLGSFTPDYEEYLRIYGRLAVNSFALRVLNNNEEENVGTALYRAASIFDHNCSPNATTVFRTGGRLEIRSMVSSPRMELSNFFISYLDEADPRLARLAKLSNTWYFSCGCERCSDRNSETSKHSALCMEGGCGGEVNVNVENWTWQSCSTCSKPLDARSQDRYKDVYEMVRTVIDENGGECNFTDVSEFMIRQMEPVFHPSDLDMMQASMSAGQGYYADRSWKKALHYQNLAFVGIKQNYGYYSGYVGLALQRLAECHHHLGNAEQAVHFIQKSYEIMKLVPGQGTELYKKTFLPIYNEIMNKCDKP